MECNKDEALRAKTIADQKLEKKDLIGAKKFALKAQTLYPGLEGIPRMLATIDVYMCAENKIAGEVDWYGVLGVTPSADDDAIKKQYRKMALMLHPDKNKSSGADGAFTLFLEAFGMLSDKSKRLAYNQRRGFRGFHQKVPLHSGGGSGPGPGPGPGPSGPPPPGPPPPQTQGNGTFSFSSRTPKPPKPAQNKTVKRRTATKATPPNPNTNPNPPPTPTNQRTDTFWTICHRCKMQYEYLNMYLNQTLLCNKCQLPFIATRTPPPVNYSSRSSTPGPKQQQRSSNQNTSAAQKPGVARASPSTFRPAKFQPGPPLGKTDPSVGAKPSKTTPNNVQQPQEKLKRPNTEESHASEGFLKKRKVDGGGSSSSSSSRFGVNSNVGPGNSGFRGFSSGLSGFSGFSGSFRQQSNSTREMTIIETRQMLIGDARNNFQKKLSEWGPLRMPKSADKEKNNSKTRGLNQDEKRESSAATKKAKQEETQHRVSHSADNNNASKENPEPEEMKTMNVPDPDFHDFDQDRTERSFGDNEVWSAYDDDDGMPRFYALVSKVLSRNPFKLKIGWLNSNTTTEFGGMDWRGSGFYKTCGEFHVGKYESCKSMNGFSQKVNWSKGPRGIILILPQKGDVWALYKNWSSDWNEKIPNEVIHQYDMAMVLDDYTEENGLSVTPLVKVVGFRTVFRPNLDSGAIKRIPKEEMFRFSHRVPHHLLNSQEEARKVPEGCLELDPAATPLELLQIITETNEEVPIVPNGV